MRRFIRELLLFAALCVLIAAAAAAGSLGALVVRCLDELASVEQSTSPVVCTTWVEQVQVQKDVGPVGSFEWCAKFARRGEK